MASAGTITEILDEDGKSYSPKRWRIFVSCGADPVSGKRRRITRTVHGTKAEARKVLDGIRREVDDGLSVDDERVTFGQFAETWHENRAASGHLSDSVLDRERTHLKLLDSYIGDVRLRDLDVKTVETLYATIKRDKIAKLGHYSGTSMRAIHVTLSLILSKAIDYDLILRNPCERVDAPKCDPVERRSLSQEEASRFLAFLDGAEADDLERTREKEQRQTEWGNLFGRSEVHGLDTLSFIQCIRIALATGARRGEVLGLTWGTVDLNAPCIKIRRSLSRYGDPKEPKSRASIRNISIDEGTVGHLKMWKEVQATLLKRLGIVQDGDTPVCCSSTGGLVCGDNLSRWWRKFRIEAGFPDLTIHELRHTQATLLLANGVDIKTVQTRLGHANASITLNCYAHAIPQNDEAAAELVGQLFSEGPKEAEVVELKTA